MPKKFQHHRNNVSIYRLIDVLNAVLPTLIPAITAAAHHHVALVPSAGKGLLTVQCQIQITD